MQKIAPNSWKLHSKKLNFKLFSFSLYSYEIISMKNDERPIKHARYYVKNGNEDNGEDYN